MSGSGRGRCMKAGCGCQGFELGEGNLCGTCECKIGFHAITTFEASPSSTSIQGIVPAFPVGENPTTSSSATPALTQTPMSTPPARTLGSGRLTTRAQLPLRLTTHSKEPLGRCSVQPVQYWWSSQMKLMVEQCERWLVTAH